LETSAGRVRSFQVDPYAADYSRRLAKLTSRVGQRLVEFRHLGQDAATPCLVPQLAQRATTASSDVHRSQATKFVEQGDFLADPQIETVRRMRLLGGAAPFSPDVSLFTLLSARAC
jgi:hypothetical protein